MDMLGEKNRGKVEKNLPNTELITTSKEDEIKDAEWKNQRGDRTTVSSG